MEEQESHKTFHLPESIMMVFLALINDGLLIVSELLSVFTIGGSLVVIEVINIAIWAILLIWFVLRTRSFGTIGWIQTVGGFIESIGIPGKTITTIACIYIANRPKLEAVAQLASGKAGGTAALKEASTVAQAESKAAELSKAASMNKRSEELAKSWGEKLDQKTGGRLIDRDKNDASENDYSQEGFINKNLDNVAGNNFEELSRNDSEDGYKKKGADLNGNDIDLRNAA